MDVDLMRLRELRDRYGIARLEVFGSTARGEATSDSDIDLLYTVTCGHELGWEIEDCAGELSDLLGARVDLVSRRTLTPVIREQVLREARPFYDAGRVGGRLSIETLADMSQQQAPMTFELAHAQFLSNVKRAHDLVEVHRRSGLDGSGKSPRGRRTIETSINRAIVLMAVSTWQASVEDLVIAAFNHTPHASNQARLKQVMTEVEAFATPNPHKVRGLFARNISVDDNFSQTFDPACAWTWTTRGGQGIGRIVITPDRAAETLHAWTLIRHAVAHGHDSLFERFSSQTTSDVAIPYDRTHPPSLDVILSNLETRVSRNCRSGGSPTLSLTDARQCLTLFNRLTAATAKSVMTYVGYAPTASLSWTMQGRGVY